MLTLTGRGALQQPPPEGEILSQLPPLPVIALAVKRIAELSLTGIVRT